MCWSPCRCRSVASTALDHPGVRAGACLRSFDGPELRRARRRRRLLRHAVDARGPPRRHLVPRAAGPERVRVRAEGRREAPGRVARAVRRRRARPVRRAGRARPRSRRPVRLRDLARPRHQLRVGRRPGRAPRQAAAPPRRGRLVVPAAPRRHPDAARPRPAPGRARHLAARRVAGRARRRVTHDVPDRVRRHEPSPYLAELGAGLPPDVDVMWTGPTVCSPQLRADDARGWTEALGGPRTVVWDNTPVNDAMMTNVLHLGPYRGRDPDLVDVVGGVLCNPMTQARASLVQLATAMDFLRDPDGYDADAAWARAPRRRRRRAAPRRSPCSPARAPTARWSSRAGSSSRRWSTRSRPRSTGPDRLAPAAELAAELRAVRDAARACSPPGDDAGRRARAVGGCCGAHATAGLAALRLIQQASPVAVDGPDGGERVLPPDPEPAMHHAFALAYAWMGARADEKVVFGPRFAVYTPVVQLPDGAPALDVSASLREDANVIDRLCRLALGFYDAGGARRRPSVHRPRGPFPVRDRRIAEI